MKVRNWQVLALFTALSTTFILQAWNVISERWAQTLFWAILPVLVLFILLSNHRRRP